MANMINDELKELRLRIDSIDEKIAELFNERQRLSADIGKLKAKNGIQTLDLAREEEVMKNAEKRCGIYGRELFRSIMELSKREQSKYNDD